MNSISILKNEYPGDNAWDNYLAVFSEGWDTNKSKDQYLSLIKDEELAAILATKMGIRALDWFSSPCPALEGRTPKDIFDNEPMGTRVLRTFLMRTPA